MPMARSSATSTEVGTEEGASKHLLIECLITRAVFCFVWRTQLRCTKWDIK